MGSPTTFMTKPRRYMAYEDCDLQNAILSVTDLGKSYGWAEKQYNVPRATIYRKVNNLQSKTSGGQKGLSDETELSLVQLVHRLTDWKVPLCGTDLQTLVKHYLDTREVVHPRFKENRPGVDWLKGFLRRHNLVLRKADNVKPARFEISDTVVNVWFDKFEKDLDGVAPSNIFNYDETNFSDDPSRKKCIVRRGQRRVERKCVHSKQAFSVMFCGSASGVFLPPMVVYKAEHVYRTWIEGGPQGSAYISTRSGWFDTFAFEMWFFKIFLIHARKLAGPKVMIGDNLPSHFSVNVVNACMKEQITFCTLVPNATHLMQPLDVAVFRPLKSIWRSILERWRSESRWVHAIPKDVFPKLLRQVFYKLKSQHLLSGFEACGLSPVNRERVLSRLPGKGKRVTDPGGGGTLEVLNESCLEILKAHCRADPPCSTPRKSRGKRISQGTVVDLDKSIIWVCPSCNKIWKNDSNVWIVCDVCDKGYHLQCSGLNYEKKEYYDLDIEGMDFTCDLCT